MRYLLLVLLSLAVFAAFRFRSAETPEPACAAQPPAEPEAGLMFQSDDGGASWQDVGRGLPAGLEITALAVGGNEVFVRADDGLVYRSTHPSMGLWNGEEVKVIIPEDGENPYNAPPVHGVFAGRNSVYATMPNGGIARQVPGTNIWEFINEGIKARVVHIVAERADGALFAATSEGIFTSFDAGKSWKQTYSKDWVNTLAVQGDVVFASVYQGILRSTDSGATWDLVVADQGVGYNFAQVDGGLAALRAAGPWESTGVMPPLRITSDGGKTWKYVDGGLSGMDVKDVAQVGNTWLCSSSQGISRSTDGGQTWQLVFPMRSAERNVFYKMAVSGTSVFVVKMRAGC
jgi:hypothetical protein